MNHVESILDFQRRLIRSAMVAPRLEAMNLLGIVYSNLQEFMENRLARCEDYAEVLDSLYDIYDTWATAIYRKFPNLCHHNESIQPEDFDDAADFITKNTGIISKNWGAMGKDSDGHCRYYHAFAFPDFRLQEYYEEVMLLNHLSNGGYELYSLPEQIVPPHKEPMTNSKVAKIASKALKKDLSENAVLVRYAPIGDLPLTSPNMVLLRHFTSAIGKLERVVINFRYPIMVGFDKAARTILKHYDKSIGDLSALKYDQTTMSTEYENAFGPHSMVLPEAQIYENEAMVRLPAFIRDVNTMEMRPMTAPDLVKNFIEHPYLLTEDHLKEAWFTIYRIDDEQDNANAAFILGIARAIKKKCHVYIEMRARGEEKSNIELYQKLKELGADANLIPHHAKAFNKKVHAKLWLFRFDSPLGFDKKRVALVSTGNFSLGAQKNYRDTLYIHNCKHGEFAMYKDLFDTIIDGEPYDWNAGVDSDFVWQPKAINQRLTDEINKKIADATLDPGSEYDPKHFIYIKANHIVEPKMVKLLTEAINTPGLEVRVLARTACTLPLNIPNDEYSVKSIVGKYLEHDRFYIFGHYNDQAEAVADDVFISSADLMKRNLFERVELLQKMPESLAPKILSLFENMYQATSDPATGFFNYELTDVGALEFLMYDQDDDEDCDYEDSDEA